MHLRWRILLALTFARVSMGVQFQTIPALAIPLSAAGLSYAAIGTLTGAYLLPGVVAALAGGWLGARMGDIRTALAGLVLMVAGGIVSLLSQDFTTLLVSRLIAGSGGVMLNVMLTKMAGDWFEGRRDLPTAMGILLSSWPGGIALAMLVLPVMAATHGIGVATALPLGLCLLALVYLFLSWRAPESAGAGAARRPSARWPRGREIFLIVIAGAIWGLYNVALIGALAWGPGRLAALGMPPVEANALFSSLGWTIGLSVAVGGGVAALFPNRDVPALGSLVLTGAALVALGLALPGTASLTFPIGMGLVFGPAAAVIMTLPVEATPVDARSLGMGLFLVVYYVLMGIGPPVLGLMIDLTGDAALPIFASGAVTLICIPLWAAFRLLQRQPSA